MRPWSVMAFGSTFACACNLVYPLGGFTDGPLEGTSQVDGAAPGATDASVEVSMDVSLDAGTPRSYRDEVLADDPVAYFRLGESAGSDAKDETGKHPGTYRSVVLGAQGTISGDSNSAAQFESSSSAVVIGDFFDLPGGVPFTIEAWVEPDVIDATYRRVITKRFTASGTDEGWSLVHNSENGLTFESYRAGQWAGGLAPALQLNVYTHVVVTYEPGLLRLWVSAAVAGEFATTVSLSDNSADLVIGSLSTANGNAWRGKLDEVALYAHALPQARITAHYSAGRRQ